MAAAAPPDGAPSPDGATRAAAFFDLDRTLMAGSSAFEFARACYRAGLLTRRQLVSDAAANIRFRLQGSTDEGMEALRARIEQGIAGTTEREMLRLMPDLLAGVLPRLYLQMLDVAFAHQDEGREIYICTAAAQGLAEVIATVLRFDGAIGTQFEIVDGVYTGRIFGPVTYGAGKAEAIRALAAERRLDLEASYAYSDSVSDLPMMRAVGHPVAVNPDAPLLELARSEGWEVVTFEKLGTRLKIAGAVLTAAFVGGASGIAFVRHRRQAGGFAGTARRAVRASSARSARSARSSRSVRSRR